MKHQQQNTVLQPSSLWILAALALMAIVTMAGCGGDSSRSTLTDPGNQTIGSGIVATQDRVVQGVSGVSLSSVGRLSIRHTGIESLSITAEDNILPLLTSNVAGDRLNLGVVPNSSFSTSREILYDLTVRELNALNLSGPGTIDAMGIDAGRLEVGLSGPGIINASGSADRQVINLSGPGSYQADDLQSRIVTIDLTGPGSAVLRVSERLEAHVAIPGTVQYFGDPEVIVTGGGSVRRLGR